RAGLTTPSAPLRWLRDFLLMAQPTPPRRGGEYRISRSFLPSAGLVQKLSSMSGGPFTFATLYMVRAQICKERKIYVIEKAFSNVRLPCGSNDADTGPDGT